VYTLSRRSLIAVALLALSLFLWPSPRAQAQCTFNNGNFETSDMTGWQIYTRILSQPANWYNYTGTLTPQTAHIISAPPQGTRAAVTDHNNATTHELYQDFSIPAGQSGTVSFYLAYNNTWSSFITLNTLDYTSNQQARVDVIKTTAPNESVAASDIHLKLFQTQPGDPFVLSPTLMFFDVSSLAGQTVRLRFAEAVGLSWFPMAVDNVCFSTTRTTFTQNTPVGTNVKVNFGEVKVTYPSVTVAGNTSVQQLDPAAQTGPPAGDTFIGPAWDLSTTATATTPIHICFYLPEITDDITFNHLRMLHKVGGVWIDLPSSTKNIPARLLCGDVISLSPFAAAVSSGAPTAASSKVSGSITTPDGSPLAGATVNLNGAKSRKTITDGNGNYEFANLDTGGFYTVTPSRVNYTFNPGNRSFSLVGNVTDAAFTSTPDAAGGAVIDSADYFVRQNYLDFLGREPDESGFNFWSDQILACGGNAACVERKRINVSAAYFLSIEFQQTGGLVDGLYRASYGRRPLYAEFMPDTAMVARNVVVGETDWDRQLATNKQAFVDAWVQRPEFRAAYDGLTNDAFVDTLISHTGVGFGQSERDALVNGLGAGTITRAVVIRQIAENQTFVTAKRNEAFVMMEYFGYLRRDPDESGYAFWLNKLNQFGGNFEQAEMVKAFITSGEYRARFQR
jgi:hypothetical protein